MAAEITSEVDSVFHYSRLRRKEDQIKFRKPRKREWLSKAYRLARFGTLDSRIEPAKDFDSVSIYGFGQDAYDLQPDR